MSMKDLKKYKHIVIKMKGVLSWDEYVSTLFFIKKQKSIIEVEDGYKGDYEKFELNNDLLELVLSYNTKILLKIKNVEDTNIKNLLSTNAKIYKILFELSNFKIDLFGHDLIDVFCGFKTKERKRIIRLVSDNWFLFPDVDIEDLKGLHKQLLDNKPGAIGYFNEINKKINIFLRDKNF